MGHLTFLRWSCALGQCLYANYMATRQRIKFGGVLRENRNRPGFVSWAIIFALVIVARFIPVIKFIAFALLAFLIPAAAGSIGGWFVCGVRDELRAASVLLWHVSSCLCSDLYRRSIDLSLFC